MEKRIFEGFGCTIIERDGKFFVRYDSGESSGSRTVENRITSDECTKAMKSERDAYEVILTADRRKQH